MTAEGVVLLFGAYNPFTVAHLHIGKLAAAAYPGYEICYVPARLNYFTGWKQQDTADVLPEELRLTMAEAAAEAAGFSVTDVEIKGLVNGKTYNTVHYFREVLGYRSIVLCMGTDKVPELETWYRGKELIAENRFLIITRAGERLDSCMTDYTRRYAENFREVRNEAFADLSATKVREALKNGDLAFVRENVPEQACSLLLQKMEA